LPGAGHGREGITGRCAPLREKRRGEISVDYLSNPGRKEEDQGRSSPSRHFCGKGEEGKKKGRGKREKGAFLSVPSAPP